MITAQEILTKIKTRTRQQYVSLAEALSDSPRIVWDALFDLAEYADDWTAENVDQYAAARVPEEPQDALYVLMRLVAHAGEKHETLIEQFLALGREYPLEALTAIAGVLKLGPKYAHDERLIAFAREQYQLSPEEAWWVFVYVSRLGPRLFNTELLEWLDEHHTDGAQHWFEILAGRMPDNEWAAARYLETFTDNPAAAIDAAAHCLTGKPVLPLIKEYFSANPEQAWEFYRATARREPDTFPLDDLDFLEKQINDTADPMFDILGSLAGRSDAADAVLERFARLLKQYPQEGIDRAYYVFTNNPEYLNQGILDTVCDYFNESAYHAYDILKTALAEKPALVRKAHILKAFDAIPYAVNWAYGFFLKLMHCRPHEARICVMAQFECLGQEPPNRAHNRVEMIREIAHIAAASHVQTALSKLLQEPPAAGSRRSRGLMAILFRQQLHAKQAVMIDALRMAATACSRNDINRTPLWDFMRLLLDESGEDAVSTAAAEKFLEATYQLSFLFETSAEFDGMLNRFDVADADPCEWPPEFGVLNQDKELCRLYGIVAELACRHEQELILRPLQEFAGRVEAAQKELAFLERKYSETQKEPLRVRIANLTAAIEAWSRPGILQLMQGVAADVPADISKQHKRDIRRLTKDLTNYLRSELRRLSIETIQTAQLALYKNRLTDILGREPSLDRVDNSILPALLFFPALQGYPNNRKWLARLIEDRIEGRGHTWLWDEEAPSAWAARMREAVPGIRLDRWRRPFKKTFTYIPQNAAAEKKRRIKADLAQTRTLLEEAGADKTSCNDPDELEGVLQALLAPDEDDEEWEAPPAELVEEIRMNLERLRDVIAAPESDYEGTLIFEIETDPFEILFMGEYGFASCLSLRGSNTWSAVSNAIDIDKAIVWARDPGGNVVGRRLLALQPEGLLSYRTYTNKHGLGLTPMFKTFIKALADHIGVLPTRHGRPGPLLSDRWYDDGPA